MVNEAADATEITVADEVENPTIRQSWKANEAIEPTSIRSQRVNGAVDSAEDNEATDEAGAEANESPVNKTVDPTIRQNWQANEDNEAIVANKAYKILGADKANVIFEAAEADKVNAEADKVNKFDEINVASVMIDEIVAINEAVLVDEVIWASKAFEAIKLPRLPLMLPFSLTKYSSIFMEVKGYFGINNNQLGYLNSECFSLRN